MGVPCSKAHPEEEDAQSPDSAVATAETQGSSASDDKMPSSSSRARTMVEDSNADKAVANHLIHAHENGMQHLDQPPSKKQRVDGGIRHDFKGSEDYYEYRTCLMRKEKTLDFDYRCRARASDLENHVDAIVRELRALDNKHVFEKAPRRQGYGGQEHDRFAGDHFLSNVDLINQTGLMDVARHMPKGAHLHIHFNACLMPSVLLDIAKGMDRMFITSDLPLIADNDYLNFDRCEIQFSLLCPSREDPGDLFSRSYTPRQTMKFSEFLSRFPQHYGKASADEWLMDKLVFHDREAHNLLQTAAGAWQKFNGRTRMMKGLFNYETAYRKYTRLCLEDLIRDNIQYAEIRPNFMPTNQLFRDDGTGPIDNRGIMTIIINEVEKYKAELAKKGKYFCGIKVIYCTPRSFNNAKVKAALDECIEFKKDWPQWIAGFDLVGEEAAGYPLKQFIPEFLQFQKDCQKAKLDIPFLFHCGETLDMGTDTDGNLVDALLLGAKRIGHGFALAKHPYVMQQMRAQGVCLELCPISNEVLGLTPRVSGHSMYDLLANNVHCTVNSDNGTLFRSSLSHDFYQVLIGKSDMGLPGWKQLVLWSIEHACLDDEEREAVLQQWEKLWEEFLEWAVKKYGHVLTAQK